MHVPVGEIWGNVGVKDPLLQRMEVRLMHNFQLLNVDQFIFLRYIRYI